MAALTDKEKRKVVQRLACFEAPAEVVEWAADELEKDLSVQQVCYYDPNRSGDTSGRWRQLFKETRRSFLEDFDGLDLSHTAVRVQELTDLYEAARQSGDIDRAAQLLRQIAKEVGGKFTNKRAVDVTSTGERVTGFDLNVVHTDAEAFEQEVRGAEGGGDG
jgi:hypothetical protein